MPVRMAERVKKPGFSLSGKMTLLTLVVSAAVSFSCARKDQPGSPISGTSPGNSPASPLSQTASTAAAPKTVFKTGEAVPAGYLGYKVFRSWFSDRLSGQAATRQPGPGYLYIDLSVVNTDKKPRAVGPFKLIDETGKEYNPSEKVWTSERSIGAVAMLDPGASRRAFLIFEAPKDHQYKMKIQGFTSADAVTIELSPAATGPTQ